MRAGGVWRVDPALRAALLMPDGPPLARWELEGRLETVKNGRHRTVWRLALPAGGGGPDEHYFVKVEHGDRRRRGLRYLVDAGRCFREAVAADRVRAAGVATVRTALVGRTPWRGVPAAMRAGPLADAGPGPCGVLVTRAVEPAVPLDDVLRAAAAGRVRPAVRRALTRALAELIAKLHRAGLFHRDLHPGNLLVRGLRATPGGGFAADGTHELEPVLIDLHPLRVRRWAPGRAGRTAASLAMFAHGAAYMSAAADRLRFLAAHRAALGAEAPGGPWRTWVRRTEARRAAESRRRHARRDRHWRRGCRGFSELKTPAGPARFVTDLDPDTAAALLADPAALKTIRVLPLLGGTPAGRPRVEPVRVLELPPRVARAGWELGHALRRRGVPVAEPLLCVEGPAGGILILAGERSAAAPTADRRRSARRACAALRAWGFTLDRPAAGDFLFPPGGAAVFADPTRVRRARRGEGPAGPIFTGDATAAPAPASALRRAA